MKTLYIWDADYPWDIRVEKICNTMQRYNIEVHIASRNIKKRPQYECVGGVHVHRLKYWENEKVNYALSFPLFFSHIWRGLIDNIISRHDIDVIIVRDLPMAIAGIWAGKRNHIPVVFDMAENYTAMIRDMWVRRKYKGFNLFVRNPYLAKMVEIYSLNKFDHIFVVVEEARSFVVNAGVNPERISIIGNTPSLKELSDIKFIDDANVDIIRKRYSAIYTGGITSGRGINVVIEAIPVVIKSIPDFLFVIIGDGYEMGNVNRLIKAKNLQKYILWLGWKDHDKLYKYIKSSKIGLIPHLVSDHTNTTIPNKIFDYMACGLPVIASDTIPMKRILGEEQCGVVFKTGNANDLAQKIIEMYYSKIEYGINGIEAIKHKYNWENEENKMINILFNLKLPRCSAG